MKERMDPVEFKNLLEKWTRVFVTTIFKLLDAVPKKNLTRVIAYQLGKSASSIGANYREANRAESRVDFGHKLQIALKESNESVYWLEILDNVVKFGMTHEGNRAVGVSQNSSDCFATASLVHVTGAGKDGRSGRLLPRRSARRRRYGNNGNASSKTLPHYQILTDLYPMHAAFRTSLQECTELRNLLQSISKSVRRGRNQTIQQSRIKQSQIKQS